MISQLQATHLASCARVCACVTICEMCIFRTHSGDVNVYVNVEESERVC